jgi:tetratricopeptide (TPR) repeat protein
MPGSWKPGVVLPKTEEVYMDEADSFDRDAEMTDQDYLNAAIEEATQILEEYPDNATVLRIRAEAYTLNGERDKAIADYTRMIAVEPESPEGWNARGNLYRENREYDKAIADYSACIPLSPRGDGRYWSNRSMAYYESGNMEAALADINKAVECWEELPGADPFCIAKSLTHRGIVLWMMGEFDKAQADFERGKDSGLDKDFVFHRLGYLYCQRHEFDKAIGFYSSALEINGNNAASWFSRGVCYWNQRCKEKLAFWGGGRDLMNRAIADYTRAIELVPDRTEAYFNRGMIRSTIAQESFHMIKGIVKIRTKDDAGRLLLLSQLENMGGEDMIPQFDVLLRGLRFKRDKAGEIIGTYLGVIAKKYAEEAAGDLSRVLELTPDNPEACYQRGIIYTLLGQREQALADYERACELAPNHNEARKKRDALRKRMKQENAAE